MSMEFPGGSVDYMGVESRAVMSSTAIEAGGKCRLCAADVKTREFLARYERYDEYAPLTLDPEADYASEIVIAAGGIEPQIAAPHRVGNASPVGEYETPSGSGLYKCMTRKRWCKPSRISGKV